MEEKIPPLSMTENRWVSNWAEINHVYRWGYITDHLITGFLGPFSKISYWAFKRNPKTTRGRRPRTVESPQFLPEGSKFLNEQNRRTTTRNWNLEFQNKNNSSPNICNLPNRWQSSNHLSTFTLFFLFPNHCTLDALALLAFAVCTWQCNSDWSRAASMQPP